MKKMKSYRVRWEINVDARSAKEAAREALRIQRDPGSEAIFFDVACQLKTIQYKNWDWVSVDLLTDL